MAYSGTLSLRIPPDLHEKVAEAAAQAGISTNAYIASVLAERVDWQGEAIIDRSGRLHAMAAKRPLGQLQREAEAPPEPSGRKRTAAKQRRKGNR